MFNNCVFFIPLDHPLKWTADYQKQTVSLLKKNNLVIAYHSYAQPQKILKKDHPFISKYNKIIHVFPYHFIPFERFKIIYDLNTHLSVIVILLYIKIIHRTKKRVFIWFFHPRFSWMIHLTKFVFGKKSCSIYDCLDYFSDSGEEEKKLRKGEKVALKTATIVTTNSRTLKKLHQSIRPTILHVPSGFRYTEFKSERLFSKQHSHHPVIGFLGAINYRIDFSILTYLCKNNPHWKFQIVGPIYSSKTDSELNISKKINKLFSFKNIEHIPYTLPKKVPKILLKWHVALIPYNLDIELNKYCNPLKLYEYYYFGLPVISSPIPELLLLKHKPIIARTHSEWQRSIQDCLQNKVRISKKKELRQIAIDNSWENKILTIYHHYQRKSL